MAFPSGLALQSFLDAYDQAEARHLARNRSELNDLLTARRLQEGQRGRKEEEEVFADLAQELAARRAAPPLGAVPTLPEGLERAETEIGPPESPPPVAFGASLSPGRQARLLAHPGVRPVIQTVEEAEKAQEQHQQREEARRLFQSATGRFRTKDAAGAYEDLAKAYTRIGQHQAANQALGFALNLRQDAEERDALDQDLGSILKAEETFKTDPSVATHGALLESLSKGTSKTVRALRLQLIGNQLKGALGRDPFSAMLWNRLSRKYVDAWNAGKDPDLDTALQEVNRADPALFFRVFQDELERKTELSKAMLTALGVGQVDPKAIKDVQAIALEEFRLATRRGPRTADELAGIVQRADELAKARKQAEEEGRRAGRPPEEEEREERRDAATLMTQRNSLRLEVDALRRQLRDFAGTRTEGDTLRDELDQKLEDLRFTTRRLRDMGRLGPEKPKRSEQTVAFRMLRAKPIKSMLPEERQAVIHDVMKRAGLGGPDLTNENLAERWKKLDAKDKEAVRREIERIEGLARPRQE